MKNSKCVILSSIWEEVGFVIVEASFFIFFIISSNCKNGPEEFLKSGKAGLIYNSNIEDKLFEKLVEFKNLTKKIVYEKKLLAKINCSKFTMFSHYLKLKHILNENYSI